MEYLLWGAAVIAAYQLFVTVRVLRLPEYSRGQKVAQFLLIWGIPLFGAITCEVFLSSHRMSSSARDTAFVRDGGGNPPGMGQDGTHG